MTSDLAAEFRRADHRRADWSSAQRDGLKNHADKFFEIKILRSKFFVLKILHTTILENLFLSRICAKRGGGGSRNEDAEMRNLERDLRIRLESCAFISSEFPQLSAPKPSEWQGVPATARRRFGLAPLSSYMACDGSGRSALRYRKEQMQRASRRRAVVQRSRD